MKSSGRLSAISFQPKDESHITWKNKAHRANWIYYQLRQAETSAAAIGRKLRPAVSRRVMSYVIKGEEKKVAEAIARKIKVALAKVAGLDFGELWGEDALEE